MRNEICWFFILVGVYITISSLWNLDIGFWLLGIGTFISIMGVIFLKDKEEKDDIRRDRYKNTKDIQ